MRYLKILFVLVSFAAFGVGVIHAEDDVNVPHFTDGRVNNYQIDAPVAIYCVFDRGGDGAVFQNVEVWGLNGEKLLNATAAQIAAAEDGAVLDSAWSYTLTKLTGGSFNVTAPNGYSFTWARGSFDC